MDTKLCFVREEKWKETERKIESIRKKNGSLGKKYGYIKMKASCRSDKKMEILMKNCKSLKK